MAKQLGAYPAKQCAHRTHLDVVGEPDLMVEPDAHLQHIFDEGNEFEDRVGEMLRDLLGKRIVMLKPDRVIDGQRVDADKKLRERRTRRAMAAGADAIWNARIVVGSRRSDDTSGSYGRIVAEADLLIGGPWISTKVRSYYPVDVKHHRTLQGASAARDWLVSPLASPFPSTGVLSDRGVGRPQVGDAMQLAHYYRALQALGHAVPGDEVLGAIIGKECELLWFNIDAVDVWRLKDPETGRRTYRSALTYYDEKFSHVIDVADTATAMLDDPTVSPLTSPSWKAECTNCPWEMVCKDELRSSDHVSLLPGVTSDIVEVYEAVGVTKRAEVAKLDRRTAILVDSHIDVPAKMLQASTLNPAEPVSVLINGQKRREQAEGYAAAGIVRVGELADLDPVTAAFAAHKVNEIHLADSIDVARVQWVDRVHRRRGVDRLDIPRGDIEIDIDMENDPGTGTIYMWGVLLTVLPSSNIELGNMHNKYHSYHAVNVAGDPDFDVDAAEADAFAGMWELLTMLRSLAKITGSTLKMYCYSPAEERCMRALARKFVGDPRIPSQEDITDLVSNGDLWVDMLKLLKGQTIWPTEDMSIKSLAKYAKFAWRDSDADGGNSIVWYGDAIGDPDPKVRQRALDRILMYNDDDVAAMLYLRDWVRNRLMGASDVDRKVPCVSVYDTNGRFRRRQSRSKVANTPASSSTGRKRSAA